MTYWNSNGRYQREADAIQELVPGKGEADYYPIEIFRCFSRLYYDRYNNGCCNYDLPYFEEMGEKLLRWQRKHAILLRKECLKFVQGQENACDDVDVFADHLIQWAYTLCVHCGMIKQDGPLCRHDLREF